MNGHHPPALSVHAGFIQSQLPTWLARAPEAMRKALRDSLIRSNQSRHDLQALLHRLQSPEAFARPLLRNALRRKFYGLLNDEKSLLRREWKNHHLFGLIKTHARTTEQTLLEAALQNFDADEAQEGGMEAGSGVYSNSGIRNPISPAQFASFCRTLDIGRYYQYHLDQVLGPRKHARRISSAEKRFNDQERTTFEVALHVIYLKGGLAKPLYEQLLALQKQGSHPDLSCSHLTLDSVVLPNVLVIQTGSKHLLYIPEDPVTPFRLHLHMSDLESELAARLDQSPDYLRFFKRLVPLQHRETLLNIKPAWSDWTSVGATGKPMPISLEALVSRTTIAGDLFLAITHQRIDQIKRDARTLAVPTADADAAARQKRLQSFLDLGQSLLFFAASFVPIVGEVLLVVSAAQLVHSIYHGFAAWSRGDSDEALNDLLDVVDSVALAAVTAGAVKTAGYTVGLVKVKLRQGGERLWNPDPAPYRHLDKTLPDGLPANAQGLYTHEQQQYIKLDDHLHSVKRDPQSQAWQLQHPKDPDAYTPTLLSNGVGGWRMAQETPQDWDSLKLIKRLGPDASNITQAQVEPLLLLGGLDNATLRETHQQMLRPPPLLRDTLKRFNLDEEIQAFDTYRAEGSQVTPYTPFIQFHSVCSLAEWPKAYLLKVVDEHGATLLTHGTSGIEIRVPEARFRKGDLLHCLADQLPTSQFNELLPASRLEGLSNVENLALRLTEQARQHPSRLFSWLNQTLGKATSASAQQIGELVPELSTSHVEELAAVLSPAQQRRLLQEKSLTAEQHWEADQYRQQMRASRARASLHMDSADTTETPAIMLSTLEQVPGWPTALRIEIREKDAVGQLLFSSGAEEAASHCVITRSGEHYQLQDSQGLPYQASTNLLDAITHGLTDSQLKAVLTQSNTRTLKQALHNTNLRIMSRGSPAIRAKMPRRASFPSSRQLDPLFADPTPPDSLNPGSDGVYEAPALPGGSSRFYILHNAKYFQVRFNDNGWQLMDNRSPFRAYQPFIRKRQVGGWELDQSNVGPLAPEPWNAQGTSAREEFESAESDSEYLSAEEGATVYMRQELQSMRAIRSYQFSQNYLGIYDRANNGRYPLRNEKGEPMRIKKIEINGRSRKTGQEFSKAKIMPFIQWEGFEKVAALYDDKLKVVSFTAAHQRFPEEVSLIGQSTVITTRAISKDEPLGVYGGELLPEYIAANRRDPYLLDVYVDIRPGTTTSSPINPVLALSGDNLLSRINTLFEYESGKPVKQAKTGYNVVDAAFLVDTQVKDLPMERLQLVALFAGEDLEPGTELRWNYGYDEAMIEGLFAEPR